MKQPFLKAGIITVTDRAIADSLKKLNEDYRLMLKIKARVTESAIAKKEEYEAQIGKTYNITDANARALIANDKNRSTEAKDEDLAYYDDYFGPNATRRMAFATRDKSYDASLQKEAEVQKRSQEREEQVRNRREREEERLSQEETLSENVAGDNIERNDQESEECGSSQDENENAKKGKRYRKRKRLTMGEVVVVVVVVVEVVGKMMVDMRMMMRGRQGGFPMKSLPKQQPPQSDSASLMTNTCVWLLLS